MPDQDLIFPVPAAWNGKAWIDEQGYRRAYERSLRDPDGFWGKLRRGLGSRVREEIGPERQTAA